MAASRSGPDGPSPERARNVFVAAILAWLVPGAGHLSLGRRRRAVIFCLVVFGSLAVGCFLGGELYRPTSGQPLMTLAGYACMGIGIVYFVLQYAVEYQADVAGAGFEYGKAFILTAGLMNILLVLDAIDIGRGEKR